MQTKDIRNALKARLESGSFAFPIAWPNVDHAGEIPRFETSFTGVNRIGDGVQGNQILEETGQFNVVVVATKGQGEDAGNDFADQVAALFLEGSSLTITDGEIVMTAPTEIRGGFPTDSDYRIPVAIMYHALRI